MQTLITSSQMQMVDKFTIANTPIASIDLMERAAKAFTNCFLRDEFDTNKSIAIFCGKGNNGGDGLAIAHFLLASGYKNIKVYIVNFSEKQSNDFTINLQRLEETKAKICTVNTLKDVKNVKPDLIIDAILGSGLNKPLESKFADLAKFINQLNSKIYAVDVPTGFFAEGILPSPYNGVKAYKTICFERPKLNFFFPESAVATEIFEVVEIGLNNDFIENQKSDFYLTQITDIKSILKTRKNFTHKGTYGHALIIAGSTDTMGAALLASSACLYAGAGLTTASIPHSGFGALNTLLPEVMALPRDEYTRIENPAKYQAIAIGPGLGKSIENERLLESLIATNRPLVIDADALNILSEKFDLIEKLTENTILTPHVKEFDRLFGNHNNWWSRVETAKTKAKELKLVIVLKNQFTFICLPNGEVHINPTGNPAMAQGGMGDILTGIITAFIAQQYTPQEAVILACFIHGQAGDSLAKEQFVVSALQVAKQVTKELKLILG